VPFAGPQGYLRIRLQTDAVNLIMAKVKDGRFSLAASPVHKKEIEAISDPYERTELLTILREKRVESVKRHRGWQKQLDKDLFFDEVFSPT
jgi:hypothetical protein